MPTSFHMCVGDTIHFSVPEPEQITTDCQSSCCSDVLLAPCLFSASCFPDQTNHIKAGLHVNSHSVSHNMFLI